MGQNLGVWLKWFESAARTSVFEACFDRLWSITTTLCRQVAEVLMHLSCRLREGEGERHVCLVLRCEGDKESDDSGKGAAAMVVQTMAISHLWRMIAIGYQSKACVDTLAINELVYNALDVRLGRVNVTAHASCAIDGEYNIELFWGLARFDGTGGSCANSRWSR
jgi:hypothetical protein